MSHSLTLNYEKSLNFESFGDGEPCVLGIDEAGRGPVLGPMVYACAISPLAMNKQFLEIGFMDSKTLTDKKRAVLFDKMKSDANNKVVSYCFVEISARHLSSRMLSRFSKRSLNEISHDSAVALIRQALDSGINVTEVYVDTVGPKDTYEAKLKKFFPKLKITVSEKADSLFPIVSAASIVAKVTRDTRLQEFVFVENHLNEKKGIYGSGYPGDAVTQKYLIDNIHPIFGFNSMVRYSWKPAIKGLNKAAVKCTWVDNTNQQKISSFFQVKAGNRVIPRCKYFNDRKLESAVNF
ncbi:unnamed protein product [Bursaphelenchus okinawaensis]|uniref:Ribonuclease n=1 Tax=Bursaphelenchus okinawaensis TaxID=465554 RepID=A0A811K6X6_9BILA|nr:unnamed protein product [Bursaphelenchus okinawaensis]CAG9092694.1 unnamed protein product [Bursaphelenchus okinawaensis]